MNILINSDFVALRKGSHVSANEAAGEFILNSDSDLGTAVLDEIINANHLKVAKSNKKSVKIAQIITQLEQKEMPEQNEKTESQKIEEIVREGFDAGKDEDAICLDILNAGFPFKKVRKLYKMAVKSMGLQITAADRYAIISEYLESTEFTPDSFEAVQSAANAIANENDAISVRQATVGIRKWCKENELEMPKKVRRAKGNFRTQTMRYILENRVEVTPESLEAWVRESKPDHSNPDRLVKGSLELLAFADAATKAANGEEFSF